MVNKHPESEHSLDAIDRERAHNFAHRRSSLPFRVSFILFITHSTYLFLLSSARPSLRTVKALNNAKSTRSSMKMAASLLLTPGSPFEYAIFRKSLPWDVSKPVRQTLQRIPPSGGDICRYESEEEEGPLV